MLTGVRGVGKTTTARIIARALNCIGPDGKRRSRPSSPAACEPCVAIADPPCRRAGDGRRLRTGVDDMREIIEACAMPRLGALQGLHHRRSAHAVDAAFNALLKTLEEPPPHVKFVFATTEIRKVPVTVLSRCQRFDLRRIERAELAACSRAIAPRKASRSSPARWR
jgi:DNA polymerase-3 subunit gamma/tau